MSGFHLFHPNGDDDKKDAANPLGPGLRDIPLRMIWPNLVTVLAICAGLTGVRLAIDGDFHRGVMLLLLAAFLDGADGRIARMLKASSRFGEQLDSLADIVNFGVVPALLLHLFLLDKAGSIGWIASLIFCIACGLRLARFNVMLESPGREAWQSEYFVGVPAPLGAILLMLPIYLGLLGVERSYGFALISSFYALGIAMLMVSRIPVWSGKALGSKVRRDLVFPIILAFVVAVLIFAFYTWYTLVVLALGYLIAIPASARAYSKRLNREMQKQKASEGETAV